MIIAGWVQSYRVHGLRLNTEALISRGVTMGQSSDKVVVVTTFSHEALEPVYGRPGPRYAFVGEATTVSASTRNLAESDGPEYEGRGSWLLIEVMGRYEVPPDLDAQFASDPDRHLNAVLQELRDLLRLRGQPLADLASGACAAYLSESVFSLVVDAPAVWPRRDTRFAERSYQLEILVPAEVDERRLAEIAPRIDAGLHAPSRESRALQVTSHWFLRARVQPPKSLDCFAGMFLVLEALVIGLASAKPTSADAQRLDALENLAREHDESLVEYVAELRSRCASPGLTERFRRLAARLFPDQSDHSSDVQAFEELNRLRNRLLHPSRRYHDLTPEEIERASQATELAQRYLHAAFSRGMHGGGARPCRSKMRRMR